MYGERMATYPGALYMTIVPYGATIRRAHKKSRTGCYMCKIRHVKCGEEKPRCSNCASKGRDCQYSAWTKRWSKKQGEATGVKDSSLEPTVEMPLASASFTLHDLRLFHHFLCFAYPPLPLANKLAWTQDVPQLSHHSGHLMNALLALAASHMSSLTGVDNDKSIALFHKGRAISGLKHAFAKSHHSPIEYDVMLATCYALAFQSALLPGSAVDFATFIRGCALITGRIQDEGKQSIFNTPSHTDFSPAHGASWCKLSVDTLVPGSRSQALLSKGMASLLEANECIAHTGTGYNLVRALESTFSGFQVSLSLGYDRFRGYYGFWFKLAEPKDVFSPDAVNEAAFLLWAFFIGLQLLVTMFVVEITRSEMKGNWRVWLERSEGAAKMIRMAEWLLAIEIITPTHLRKHLSWPTLVSGEVLSVLQMTTASKTLIEPKIEVLRNLGSRSHTALGTLLELSASLANWTDDLLAARSGEEESGGGRRVAESTDPDGLGDSGPGGAGETDRQKHSWGGSYTLHYFPPTNI